MTGEDQKIPPEPDPLAAEDYYIENGLLVFTESFHLKRGFCCGSGCRHCPYAKLDKQDNS